jgi:catechol 2,3-dioxygenase-like lactoylglutathione lyase family enzyme
MSDSPPESSPPENTSPAFTQLNLVVSDVAASLDFYRRLGVATPDYTAGPNGEDPGDHAELALPGGVSLELDTAASARIWHAGYRSDPASVKAIIGFSFPTRRAVDDRYAELTAAGCTGRQPPYDAFWGGRYAIVADPDGNDVALTSPIDPALRTWPPQESPSA